MDHALLVRRLERLGDLHRHVERVLDRQRSAREPLRQVLAGDELHRDEALAFRLVQAVDRGDVRVVQRREQACLALEASHALRLGGDSLRQDLDRDVALELRVARPPHDAHPALTDLLGQAVVQELPAGLEAHGS